MHFTSCDSNLGIGISLICQLIYIIELTFQEHELHNLYIYVE